MREPRDFNTSMNGVWSSVLMAGAQALVDNISRALGAGSWGFLSFLPNTLRSILDDVSRSVINSTFPGAPGAVDYFTAGPEAMANAVGVIATTLVEMQYQRRYLQNTLIPQAISTSENLSWSLYYTVRSLAYSLYNSAIGDITGSVNALYASLASDVAYLSRYIGQVQSGDLAYAKSLYQAALAALAQAVVTADARMDALNARMTTFVTGIRDALQSSITTLRLEAFAAIAAATAYITVVAIPGALAAYTELTIAQIALGMDILWPIAARQITHTAEQFIVGLPLVAARALDVPPEAVPGIGGLAEALASATVFATAVQDQACAPLWTQLHQFGEDTAELDGVVATVLLAGLVTAMVTAPVDTAAGIADAIAGPLNDMGVAVLSLIGLG
jgi:hypothetical protein